MAIQDALPMLAKTINEEVKEEYIEVPILGIIDSATGKVEFLNKVIETVRVPKKLLGQPIKSPLSKPKALKSPNLGSQPISNN